MIAPSCHRNISAVSRRRNPQPIKPWFLLASDFAKGEETGNGKLLCLSIGVVTFLFPAGTQDFPE